MASEAQRPEGAGDERRHREQRESGERAGDEREEELHRHPPRRFLRPPPTIPPDFAGEALEPGHDRRAVAFGRYERGGERPRAVTRPRGHLVGVWAAKTNLIGKLFDLVFRKIFDKA